MAGIQIDGVNNKIDFDDDLDTSISANTDDTLVFEIAGATDFTMTANDFTALSGSVISTDNINETTSGSGVTIDGVLLKDGNITMSGLAAGSGITLDLAGSDNYIIEESSTNDIIDFGQGGANTKFSHNISSGALTIRGASTITVADNSNALTLISTDADAASGPTIRLFRDSATAADGDNLGFIKFDGKEEGDGGEVGYLVIQGKLVDSADGAVDGALNVEINKDSSGKSVMFLGPTEAVFNEDSADIDFRVESNNGTHRFFVDGGNNIVIVGGNDGAGTVPVPINTNGGTDPVFQLQGANNANEYTMHLMGGIDAQNAAPAIYFSKSRSNTLGQHTILQNGDRIGELVFCPADGNDRHSVAAFICADVDGTPGENDTPGRLEFHTTADGANTSTERARITSVGRLLVGKNSSADATVGCELRENGQGTFTRSGGPGINVTRNTNDGELIKFIQDASLEGTISVSGTTVSYNGFTGSHWSRLADNSKPTILRGTIMDSIDEMCDWYQAVADVAEVNYTADDAEVIEGDKNVDDVKTEAHKIIEEIALPSDKSVGDAVTFTSNGVEYTGKYVKEGDVKHVKSKVSDTADSTKIYGVFSHWDEEGADTVNDMFVSQVGTYVIRVHKDVTVAAGDLLVSNGDGTAKVQDDDIIRSKTVAKVNSNIKVETYSDGSYTVPCTLHC